MIQKPKISVTSPPEDEHIQVIFNNEYLQYHFDENNNSIKEAQKSPGMLQWQPLERAEHQKPSGNGSIATTTKRSAAVISPEPSRRNQANLKTKCIRILFMCSLIFTAMFLVFYPLITFYIEENNNHNETESADSDDLFLQTTRTVVIM
jgi:hypothetical protein